MRELARALPGAHQLSLESAGAQLEEVGTCCKQPWENRGKPEEPLGE